MVSVDSPDPDDTETFRLTKQQKARHFGSPTSDDKIHKLIEQRVPPNTKQNTNWCMGVWKAWSDHRKLNVSIKTLTAEELNNHLCKFIVEVNRQDGDPPDSLYQIVVGLQHHLKENGRPELGILDDKNLHFVRAHKVPDGRMKQLTASGVGTVKKLVQPLTHVQEDSLWDQGIFGLQSADSILNAVFWYNCKCFGLRGGDKHRTLVAEQYSVDSDDCGRCLRFVGRSCKNYQGGLQHR